MRDFSNYEKWQVKATKKPGTTTHQVEDYSLGKVELLQTVRISGDAVDMYNSQAHNSGILYVKVAAEAPAEPAKEKKKK